MAKIRGALVVFLLVACAAGLFAGGAGEKNVTLSIILNQTWNKEHFVPILKAYSAAHPGVTIDPQIIPDEQFTQLVKTRFATGEYMDIYWDSFGQIQQNFKVPDLLTDLSSEPWVSRLVDPGAVTDTGKIYGFPTSLPPVEGVVYNKKVFQQVGVSVPRTWDELLAVSAKIRAAGIDPFTITAKDVWTVGMWVVEMVPLAVKDRPGIWNDLNTGKVKFDQVPAFTDVFAKMQQLVTMGYANKDLFSAGYDVGNDQVATGKAAMEVQGEWAANDIVKKYPDAQVGLFPLPLVNDPVFTSGFVAAMTIPQKSKNIEASKGLIRYFAEPAQVKIMAGDGFVPPAVKDVSVPLPPWTQAALNDYTLKGKPPIAEMGVASLVGMGQLSTYTTSMLDGSMKVEEVIPAWAKYFAEQAAIRKLPGW